MKAVAAVQKYYEMHYMHDRYWLAGREEWQAAWEKVDAAKQLGLLPDNVGYYGDDDGFYLSIPCFEILMNNQWLPCAPISEEYAELSEDAGLWVPYYKVASNLTVDVMTKYYNTFVDEAMKQLGVEATATTEATGLYGELASAQALLTEKKRIWPPKSLKWLPLKKPLRITRLLWMLLKPSMIKLRLLMMP